MDAFLGFLVFILITTVSPGPNNLLLAASGIQYGFKATLPHLMGIHCGIYLLVLLCGLGVGQVLITIPEANLALKIFGSGYLLYLAWKVIDLHVEEGNDTGLKSPMTALQAFVFQFSNPKAWMMATSGINFSLTVGGSVGNAVILLCAGFATIGMGSNCLWVLVGSTLRQSWRIPFWRSVINSSLTILTLGSVALFWI